MTVSRISSTYLAAKHVANHPPALAQANGVLHHHVLAAMGLILHFLPVCSLLAPGLLGGRAHVHAGRLMALVAGVLVQHDAVGEGVRLLVANGFVVYAARIGGAQKQDTLAR
jgi:hypothetical protein